MRCAIYARYSSDLQDAASIDDQMLICRERARREGWTIVREYADAAISGAFLMNRPAAVQLLADARAGLFDVLLCEALDRLSRDQEHIAGLYKRLTHAGIGMVTLAEGRIDPLHIGFKGTMNQITLRDLADKLRRRARGQTERGRAAGGLAYGYRVVRRFGDDGRPVTGLREIAPDQAAVVQRIFRDYVAGKGPRLIARDLNAEGIPSPGGGLWHASMINGSAKRRTGILHNELYAGRMTYNRQTFRKDPDTGRRVPKVNPQSDWTIVAVPDLRIVDDRLWTAAQAARRAYQRAPAPLKQRPRHLLAGLLRCGVCGATMVKVTGEHIGCGRRKEAGACGNRKRVKVAVLEDRIIDGIRRHLLAPEAVAAFIDGYRKAMAARDAGAARSRADLTRRIDRMTREIRTIVRAIAEERDTRDMRDEMMRLDRQRAGLEADLAALDRPALVALHPNAADIYRARLADLQSLLAIPEARTELIDLLRGVVAEIRLTPDPAGGRDIMVDVVGDLAGIFVESDPLRIAEPFPVKMGNVLVAPGRYQQDHQPRCRFWLGSGQIKNAGRQPSPCQATVAASIPEQTDP